MLKWFNNLKTSIKIGILAGALLSLSLALAIGGTAIYMIQKISFEIQEIAEENLPLIEILSELEVTHFKQVVMFEQAIQRSGQGVASFDIGNQDTEAKFVDSVKQFAELSEVLASGYLKTDAILSTAIGRAPGELEAKNFAALRTGLKEYLALNEAYEEQVDTVFRLLDQDQFQAAMKQFEAVKEQGASVHHKIEGLVESVEEQAHAAVARAKAQEKITFSIIVSLLVTAALFGPVFAWAVVRSIIKPLYQIIGAAERLAAGEDAEISGEDRADEIGVLMRTLNVIYETSVAATRIRAAVDSSSAALMVTDANLTITYVNPSLQAALGRSREFWRQHDPAINLDDLVGTNIDIFHQNPAH